MTFEVMSKEGGHDIAHIVLRIKYELWLKKSGSRGPNVYHADFTADFLIVYVKDGTHQLTFLSDEQMRSFSLSPSRFRNRAITNLKHRLPKVERHCGRPLYHVHRRGRGYVRSEPVAAG